jgi:uncharacterized coiled-coil protein SlyX
MNQTLQEIQKKLDLLYARLEAANAEIDMHPTAEKIKRIDFLDTAIDLLVDQLLQAEKQASNENSQG